MTKLSVDAETIPQNYRFNHTMIRVRDPQESLRFYQEFLGMQLIRKCEFDEAKFSLYFLGFQVPSSILSASDEEKHKYVLSCSGILELTHNWGTESDEDFKGYCSGNDSESKGFGHIALVVDDLKACCERLQGLGVKFKKLPHEGRMKTVAFALDPDGYWIELLGSK